jgi:hypothetical protein
MAFCGLLFIAPALRKGEAVMHPGVHLDLAGNACQCEQTLQFLDHWQRCEIVMFGTGNIELAFDLAQ